MFIFIVRIIWIHVGLFLSMSFQNMAISSKWEYVYWKHTIKWYQADVDIISASFFSLTKVCNIISIRCYKPSRYPFSDSKNTQIYFVDNLWIIFFKSEYTLRRKIVHAQTQEKLGKELLIGIKFLISFKVFNFFRIFRRSTELYSFSLSLYAWKK